MKRIAVVVWLLAGCGAPELEVAPVAHAITADKTAPATAAARDDGSSNPMPGQPPAPADAPTAAAATAPSPATTATSPSNPMPGQPVNGLDPLAGSNPMPGLAVTAATLETK